MKHDRLPDHQARLAALTDTGCSLLVEAGAGSGKTSIIAGRVAVLLASGPEERSGDHLHRVRGQRTADPH